MIRAGNGRHLLLAFGPVALVLSALLVLPGSGGPHVVYGQDAIPGRYIVVLKDGVDPGDAADAMGNDLGFEADAVYEHAVRGFAAEMSAEDAQELAESDSVALVTADRRVHVDIHQNNFQTLPTGVNRIDGERNATAAITGTPGPNLNTDVAIIDTGVLAEHVDLNVAGGASLACTGNTFADGHGHGTHVAGTIAGIDDAHGVAGVAPGARIWAVKVLDDTGNGEDSCVIAGIDWVTDRRLEFNDGAGDGDPGIDIIAANMSIGGPSILAPELEPLCIAVNSGVAAGVMFAVAAGNESDDAINHAPAKCMNAVTVSAFGDFDGLTGALSGSTAGFGSCPVGNNVVHDDTFACFSNWGTGIDIAAPGVNITSTFPGPGPNCEIASCYAGLSGTSMATPHVTGALLLLHLEGYNGPADAASVMAGLAAFGHTLPQSSVCGFTGDHGGPNDTAEPVLYLGTGQPDGDGDGIGDSCDNCPANANANQTNTDGDSRGDICEACPTVHTDWITPPGDGDCDGFIATIENFIGTSPSQDCAATAAVNDEPTPDAWPVDFDDNQHVTITDVTRFSTVFNAVAPAPPYSPRYDFNGDGKITLTDVLKFIPFFGKSCTP